MFWQDILSFWLPVFFPSHSPTLFFFQIGNSKLNRKFESSFFSLLKQRNVILSISSSREILFQLEFFFHPVFFLNDVLIVHKQSFFTLFRFRIRIILLWFGKWNVTSWTSLVLSFEVWRIGFCFMQEWSLGWMPIPDSCKFTLVFKQAVSLQIKI